jgi:plastocyanin
LADSFAYYPQVVSNPGGMSVIWYNDDVGPHTVTTMENAPEEFNFTIIHPGGFDDFTFTKPGIFDYYDKMFPTVKGRIIIGEFIEVGEILQ